MDVKEDQDVPEEFLCPINHQIMQNPVMCSDGHNYEREAIEKAYGLRRISPLTNEEILPTVYPNIALRNSILDWKKNQHKHAKNPSTVAISKELERKVRAICFMQERHESKGALASLVCMMKDYGVFLSEFYVTKLLENYNGDEKDKDAFCKANVQIKEKAKKKIRMANSVVSYARARTTHLEKKVFDLKDAIDGLEFAVEKLNKKKRRAEEELEGRKRVSDVYVAEKEKNGGRVEKEKEEEGTNVINHKKRKFSTQEGYEGDEDGGDHNELHTENARDIIMESIEYYMTDEWRNITLWSTALHMKHPLAILVCKLKGWHQPENQLQNELAKVVIELESYANETTDTELACIAKIYVALHKCGDGTEDEHSEGIAMLIENAKSGCSLSMVLLAGLCRSVDEKRHWAKRALDAGHVAGGMCMALTYHDPDDLGPLKEDVELGKRVKQWMQASAEADVTRAQYWLARYVQSKIGCHASSVVTSVLSDAETHETSYKLYEMAAKKGHSAAMFEYGRSYIESSMMSATESSEALCLEEGLRWLRRSADRGYTYADEYIKKNVDNQIHRIVGPFSSAAGRVPLSQ